MKICSRCNTPKPIEEFAVRSTTERTYHTFCKQCHNERCETYRTDEYRHNQYDTHLKRTLGIGIDQYQRMLSEQGGACAICKTQNPQQGRRHFCVDHDHVTGKIRGLLCANCNKGIGLLQDDLRVLRQAVNYLDSHQDTEDHNG